MLYYPGFEAQDVNWLKFALLYLDELRPIIPSIPYNKETYLSNHTIRIMDETNFIRPYCPDYQEGTIASQYAIEDFDNYIRNHGIFNRRFGSSYKSTDSPIDRWKFPHMHNYTLYNGKFSDDFHEYCLHENIATECKEGIKVHRHIAHLYMSLLSEQISLRTGLETITDCSTYSTLLLERNTTIGKSVDREFQYAKNNIELHIPTNIRCIPLEQIIKLRSTRSFNQLRRAYVNEIKNLVIAKENKDAGYSLDDLLRYQRDFRKLCTSSLGVLSSITLTAHGVSQLINGTLDASAFVTVAEIHGGIQGIQQFSKNTIQSIGNIRKKRLARKYLATLKNLPSHYNRHSSQPTILDPFG